MTRVFYGPGFPAAALSEVQEIFSEVLGSVFGNDSEGADEKTEPRAVNLPIDVEFFEDEVIARADVPGVTADEVEIEAANDLVTIFVKVKEVAEDSVKPKSSRYERPARVSSKRAFRVRRDFDPAAIKAELVDGILTVTVPLKELPKPVTIKVSTTPSAE